MKDYHCGMLSIANATPALYNSALPSLSVENGAPLELSVVGRMKAGKSSLINALLGSPLLVTDVDEATATINRVSWGTSSDSHSFSAFMKDGSTTGHPAEDLQKWSGKSESVRLLAEATAYLQFHQPLDSLKSITIVDTPGTGSVEAFHEQATTDYLSRQGASASAVIYVIPPVARESDAGALNDFEQGRLPNMGPYNTVGVIHKWDALSDTPYEQARSMADTVYAQLKDKVAAVIPISAPLALFAKIATEDDLSSALLIAKSMSEDGLATSLRMDMRWDSDPQRRALRVHLKNILPWPSFKLIIHMARVAKDTETLRSSAFEKSGIKTLEHFIRQKFAGKESLIRSLAQLNNLASINQSWQLKLQQQNHILTRSSPDKEMDHIFQQVSTHNKRSLWALDKLNDNGRRLTQLYWLKICHERLAEGETFHSLEFTHFLQTLCEGKTEELDEASTLLHGLSQTSPENDLKEMFRALSLYYSSNYPPSS